MVLQILIIFLKLNIDIIYFLRFDPKNKEVVVTTIRHDHCHGGASPELDEIKTKIGNLDGSLFAELSLWWREEQARRARTGGEPATAAEHEEAEEEEEEAAAAQGDPE